MTGRTTTGGDDTLPTTLSQRDLNRATLARQHLLARTTLPAFAMIEHLVGMQAQLPRDPYVGLWSRLEGFDAEEPPSSCGPGRPLARLFMRSTIHLTSAADAAMLFSLLATFQYQRTMTGTPFGKRLRNLDHDELRRVAREIVVEESPRSTAELGPLLVERFPGHDGEAMAIASTRFVPMVQVTPRGLWRESGQTRWTTAESWLDMPLAESPSRQDLVLRYLAAFGPASVMDMQNWSGLTKLQSDFEALRPHLLTFQTERGKNSSTSLTRHGLRRTPRRPFASCRSTTTFSWVTQIVHGSLPRTPRSRKTPGWDVTLARSWSMASCAASGRRRQPGARPPCASNSSMAVRMMLWSKLQLRASNSSPSWLTMEKHEKSSSIRSASTLDRSFP